MNRRFIKYFSRNLSLLAPAIAAVASLVALSSFFLKDFAPSSTIPILMGTFASLAGAALAYAFSVAMNAASREMPAVFISYSHQDLEFVEHLAAALKDMDVAPIVDRLELRVGDDIRSAVDNMIDRSDYFLFVISQDSADSDWAKKEIEQAAKREKRILPVVLSVEAIPEQLSGMYYADFSTDFDNGLKQLRKTFGRELPSNG